MPTFMTEAIARTLYKSPVPQQVINGVIQNPQPPITYGPDYDAIDYVSKYETRRNWLTGRGLDNNADVLVVGCGYGALIAYLIDAGINTYGLEPGSWIWDNINDFQPEAAVRAVMGDDWVGSGTEKATLNALGFGGNARFTFVVDEDAAPAHTDAELPAFISGLEDRLQGNARGRIIHIVSVMDIERGPGDSSQNWKTLADWKAVEPAHTWVDRRGNIG